MSSDLSQLERSVHGAYERGRLKGALYGAALLLLVCAVGLVATGRGLAFHVIAMGLATLVGIYIWRGGDWGNALLPGLAAGLVPLLLSSLLLDCRAECSGLCIRHCMTVCAVGATMAGILAAVLMRHHPRRHRAWLFAVALVPATGLLGCPHVGYGQLLGLTLGLVIAKAVVSIAGMRTGKVGD